MHINATVSKFLFLTLLSPILFTVFNYHLVDANFAKSDKAQIDCEYTNSTCQTQNLPKKITHNMLIGSDTRFNVLAKNCVTCHNNTIRDGNLNLLDAEQTREKRTQILSRMKSKTNPMPPMGRVTNASEMSLIERWVKDVSTNDISISKTSPKAPPSSINFTCDSNSMIPQYPIKRISKLQYTNAIIDLLNSPTYLHWSENTKRSYRLKGLLAPLIKVIPNDNIRAFTFRNVDPTISIDHFLAYFAISTTISDLITKDPNWLKNESKVNCLELIAQNSHPSETCIRTFIRKFGQKALRKKIDLTEETSYLNIYRSGNSAQDGFATLVQTFLLSPRFINIIEIDGKALNSNSNLLKLNDYELAQRLSFHFLGSVPNDAMMKAAEAGAYSSSEQSYKAEVVKVLQIEKNLQNPNQMPDYSSSHPSSLSNLQKNYYYFISEWLKVDMMPELTPSKLITQVDSIHGLKRSFDNSEKINLVQEAIRNETYNYVQRLIWVSNKTFSDLMTDKSVISNEYTRSFYNLPEPTNTDNEGYATQSMVHHTGLLTRAIVTYQDGIGDDTHPFIRGAFIRRNILCDPLPSVNADLLSELAFSIGFPLHESKRKFYEAKVATPNCMKCHSQINSLGLALDDFDSLSRFRKFEPVFETQVTSKGNVKYEHRKNVKVDTYVTDLNIDSPTGETSNGGAEFSRIIGNSFKGNMCFARQVLRHTMGRFETDQDACWLKQMYSNLREPNGGIKKMILEMPYSNDFKLKRIGD